MAGGPLLSRVPASLSGVLTCSGVVSGSREADEPRLSLSGLTCFLFLFLKFPVSQQRTCTRLYLRQVLWVEMFF